MDGKSFVLFLISLSTLLHSCYCSKDNSSFVQFSKIFKSDFVKDVFIDGIQKRGSGRDGEKFVEQDFLCDRQLTQIVQNMDDPKVLQFFDSWGKIPSGILSGHLTDLGAYDECVNIEIPLDTNINPSVPVKGQYCMAGINMADFLPTINPLSKMDMDKTMMARAASPIGQMQTLITFGICVPSSCRAAYISTALKEAIKQAAGVELDVAINEQSCSTKDSWRELETVDIVAIVIFSVVGCLIVVNTLYDYMTQRLQKRPHPLLIAFSILASGKKLFQISTKSSPNSVECLNGIRVFSMLWVVYGHTYMWVIFGLPLINAVAALDWFSSAYSLFVQNATVSVDSFFFLSGFLLAWLGFKEMQQNRGKLNIPLMYFHRYIRLTPILGMAILFVCSIYKFFGSGPLWNQFTQIHTTNCEKYWWSTILYVQNYVNPTKLCLIHSWYLSVDTQLFFLSPLVLIPLWKFGRKFAPFIVVLALLSIGCVLGTMFTNEYHSVLRFGESNRMKLVYFPTHTRYSPWLVGIGLGYYMFMNKNQKAIIPKPMLLLGWAVSLGTIFAILFGPYHTIQPGYRATVAEAAFYEALSRVSWSIALAWIVYACHNGYGGPINSILSYPLWQPFGRLTYCIYIFHIITQTIIVGNIKTDIHFSNFDEVLSFWGAFGLTVCVSVILVLAFESPIISIEKVIFGPKTKTNAAPAEHSRNLEDRQQDLAPSAPSIDVVQVDDSSGKQNFVYN